MGTFLLTSSSVLGLRPLPSFISSLGIALWGASPLSSVSHGFVFKSRGAQDVCPSQSRHSRFLSPLCPLDGGWMLASLLGCFLKRQARL